MRKATIGSLLCVFADLGVFARNLTFESLVSRKDAKDRKDAKNECVASASDRLLR